MEILKLEMDYLAICRAGKMNETGSVSRSGKETVWLP